MACDGCIIGYGKCFVNLSDVVYFELIVNDFIIGYVKVFVNESIGVYL